MSEKFRQLFKNIQELEPPIQLETAIFRAVALAESRKIRRKIVMSYAGFLASAVALIYASATLGTAFLRSEFWSVATLLFSDAMIVASNWQGFAYSLMETFPALTLAAILVPVFTLFLSISSYLNLNNNHHKSI
jgi:hypothetical protein